MGGRRGLGKGEAEASGATTVLRGLGPVSPHCCQTCIVTHESNGIDIITALILNDISPLCKYRMDLVLRLKVGPVAAHMGVHGCDVMCRVHMCVCDVGTTCVSVVCAGSMCVVCVCVFVHTSGCVSRHARCTPTLEASTFGFAPGPSVCVPAVTG